MIHTFDLMYRSQNKEQFLKWASHLSSEIPNCPEACFWAVKYWAENSKQSDFIQELMLKESQNVCYAFSILVKAVLETVSEKERDVFLNPETKTATRTLFNLIFNQNILATPKPQ